MSTPRHHESPAADANGLKFIMYLGTSEEKRNMEACGNCQESRTKCDVKPPYSKRRCRKCSDEGLPRCPPHQRRRSIRRGSDHTRSPSAASIATPVPPSPSSLLHTQNTLRLDAIPSASPRLDAIPSVSPTPIWDPTWPPGDHSFRNYIEYQRLIHDFDVANIAEPQNTLPPGDSTYSSQLGLDDIVALLDLDSPDVYSYLLAFNNFEPSG